MIQFDVFLSHNRIDKPWARQLKADLGRYGLSAWLDEDEIRPGDLIVDALELALEQSRAIALIVSPEAMASDWVKEEYNRAMWLTKEKELPQLIPVMRRGDQLPGFLKGRKWVDFRDETTYAQCVWELVWGITGEKPEQVLDLSGEMSLPALEPSPAPLPSGSRMPLSPNPLFVGREADLQELAKVLKVRQTAAIGQMVGVTGLGGIGKTQLASEFAHRYGQYFAGGVFWLSFTDPTGVPVEVATCGGPGTIACTQRPVASR